MTDTNDPSGTAASASRQPPPGPVRDLPMWDVLEAGFRSVFIEHRAHLPRATALPGLLWIAIAVLWSGPSATPVRLGHGGPTIRIYDDPTALIAAYLLTYIWFAVGWYRLVLLGPGQARPPLLPPWRVGHWRFLGYCLLIALGCAGFALAGILVFAIFNLFSGTISAPFVGPTFLLLIGAGVAGLVALAFFTMRFSFVFPAAAVDESYRLSDSWKHTKRQGWRLVVIIVLGALPFFVLTEVLSGLLTEPADRTVAGLASVAGLLPFMIVEFLSLAVSVSLVSLSFVVCTGWVPEHGPPAART